MVKSNKSGNLLVDEIELQAQLLQNKIREIIQDEFAREMSHLVYEEARRCCEACELDDLSQLHHECMMTDEEELWVLYYGKAKESINLMKLWLVIETAVMEKLGVRLKFSWLKYLLHIFKVDETSALLLYKDTHQRRDDCDNECLKRGCLEYMQ